MEDDIVGYFKQVERFDYITIDLDKDETIIAGNVKQYDPSRLEQFIQSFKRIAQTCLEHNLRSPEELFAFWKGS
ncbi:hypothetical protein [Bacillus wiedmannii]|uniref:Uncharacterized protein n=1 Tax=Bacillus wiedmannii TaxID=1890302 RepID=A0A2A7BQJ2_9BACI|nr:hypothetical protein [Bacillus wiedmannii]KMP73657.1 helicase [Bacillus cereus]MBG9857884.1 helicase [Bacillus wiedmannii]MCQ6544397.1 hypothetical protein [Bacillus wiedmannii]MCQ6571291.1 hypothetical protein [Bacillus wiedmannii]MCU5573505.1 hypothetical protein [Bacillus wiedmannii]